MIGGTRPGLLGLLESIYRGVDCRSQGGIDGTCAEVADSNGAGGPMSN
jgi:hypothetical protein